MSESFYLCRVFLDRTTTETRFTYASKSYGWCKTFAEAMPFASRDAARTFLNDRPGTIWSESEIKASRYYQVEMKNTKPVEAKSVEIEVIPAVGKCANNAHLKSGEDAAIAKQLNKLFAEAQTGMRRIVALGLFAW